MEISPQLLDGKVTAKLIKAEIKNEIDIACATSSSSSSPKLAVILVGNRKDSSTYVSMKTKACEECGVQSILRHLPSTISQQELEAEVDKLEADPTIDGILVQLPLPGHLDEAKVMSHISQYKDVDGLHPINMGCLALKGIDPLFKPCTALGCIELCNRYSIPIEGKHVVVLGRSNIVGIPVSLLFQQENATVTICHSRTQNLPLECSRADILVVAIGKAEFVTPEFLKDGVVVLDVGINSKPDNSRKSGYRLVGDVDYEACKHKCSFITPVPGGIGPMTVAILMQNTLKSWNRKRLYKNQ